MRAWRTIMSQCDIMGEKDLSAASAGGMHPWARPTTVKAGEFEDRKDDKRLSLNCLVLMRLRLNRPLMLAAISMDGGGKILRRWSLKAAYALFGDEISDQIVCCVRQMILKFIWISTNFFHAFIQWCKSFITVFSGSIDDEFYISY